MMGLRLPEPPKVPSASVLLLLRASYPYVRSRLQHTVSQATAGPTGTSLTLSVQPRFWGACGLSQTTRVSNWVLGPPHNPCG